MVILDIDHPDIEEFINWKAVEEQKVAALICGSLVSERCLRKVLQACDAPGYGPDEQYSIRENKALAAAVREACILGIPSGSINRVIQLARQGVEQLPISIFTADWNAGAYQTVSAQNANHSVRIPESFMDALAADRTWPLTSRVTGEAIGEVSARELWESLARAAWLCADPGVQFDTTINDWHTCPKGGRINASNPCSEYMFLDDTACNLASLNLLAFCDRESGSFDVKKFSHAVHLWTLTLGAERGYGAVSLAVNSAQQPSLPAPWPGVRQPGRTCSWYWVCPTTAKAPAPWPRVSARLCPDRPTARSAEMAAELGAFEAFADNRADMLRVIRNHQRMLQPEPDALEDVRIRPPIPELDNMSRHYCAGCTRSLGTGM